MIEQPALSKLKLNDVVTTRQQWFGWVKEVKLIERSVLVQPMTPGIGYGWWAVSDLWVGYHNLKEEAAERDGLINTLSELIGFPLHRDAIEAYESISIRELTEMVEAWRRYNHRLGRY